MKIESIQEEFRVRYYYWALNDFKREIEQGFPFLRGFTNDSCVLQMMGEMTRREQLFFAKALVKRFHKEAVAINGESISSEEKAVCETYLDRSLHMDEKAMLALYGRIPGQKPNILGKRRTLKKFVILELKKAGMKMSEEEDLDGVLRYGFAYEKWNITTSVYTKNRNSQLEYNHSICSVEKLKPVVLATGEHQMWPVVIGNFISFYSWLGISGQTGWGGLVEADCPGAAQLLAKLCLHFFRGVPALLKGLAP